MMTRKELHDEFWLLTKGILQDSKVDAEEARVLKRWLEEHRQDGSFDFAIESLGRFLTDGYIDRFESRDLIYAVGRTLEQLRTSASQP
ncbi:MAG: hypothetical protein J6U17_02050 [Kiritimatiellae bacterium]|nr:hypothetical protein [Kiritimatiellia bacterium]